MNGFPAGGPTIGVEEEFFLVDPGTGELVPRNREVVDAAAAFGVDVGLELSPAQVETATPVCHSMREVRDRVVELRAVAAAAALQAGARLLAVGVPVAGAPTGRVTDTPRYRRMAGGYGAMITGREISGCHVHVGVPDRETAVQVSNHLRPWLPVLLGLTANSAVHHGRDTGFASWRAVETSRWPCAGPPPAWTSAAEYDTTVARMIDSGTVLDEGMVYWDIRPSAHLPTIEVRVSDVPATVNETALLAALVRALVSASVRKVHAGETAPQVPDLLLRAAYFRAAREGLTGRWLDVTTGRLATPTQLLTELLKRLRPELEAFGEYPRVAKLLARQLTSGNGAGWQQALWQQHRDLPELVATAARQTLIDSQPALPVPRHLTA
ncbi:glutamate--cysteine ligase [Amycolatopsis sp. NPDC051045]|uniref:carboxylate-amine ligase n=1 Tax=Amycolatopsis sp. NPDC051045 TaxID=3156922 RepID=UPI0034343123